MAADAAAVPRDGGVRGVEVVVTPAPPGGHGTRYTLWLAPLAEAYALLTTAGGVRRAPRAGGGRGKGDDPPRLVWHEWRLSPWVVHVVSDALAEGDGLGGGGGGPTLDTMLPAS